ncbi:MAG: galactokinase [Acidobacteriota bacterium]
MEPTALIEVFRNRYGTQPELWSLAPGRVNILGEHTDYNDGFVFPAAIDRGIAVVAARRRDSTVRAHSVNFRQDDQFSLTRLERSEEAPWSNYLRGVLDQLQRAGFSLSGMDLVVGGDVPVGSGLSSSAALEVATAVAVRALDRLDLDPVRLALLCQAAEREFVGVSCGIMDQFISTLAEAGSALFIDCRDLSYRAVPLHPEIDVVVCDSGVPRTLGASAYNQRRKECETAVAALRSRLGPIRALRDVTGSQLESCRDLLEEPVFRRARHVVRENERVLEGLSLLEQGRIDDFGTLLYRSHESLRNDYEVSCNELDALVDLAVRQPGTVGARMTGAGFGGCTVNLVRREATANWIPAVAEGYRRRTGRHCEVYACRAAAGARSGWIPAESDQ